MSSILLIFCIGILCGKANSASVCSYSHITGSNFYGPTGSIESPNYPNNYSNSLDCYSRISVSSGDTVVITFSTFSTQPVNDYLLITCDSDNINRLPRYSGTQIPAVTTIPSCTMVRLTFRTDSYVTNTGFSLEYSVTKACGNTYFSGPTGVISSTNYPNYYENNQDCNSYIAVPSGHTVVITFVRFYTNPSYDFVKITCASGTNFTSPYYYGSQIPAALTIASCKLVKVYFHSDSSTTYPGFSLMYNMTSDCVKTYFSGSTGTISSTNYPNAYTNNLDCYSYISVPSGHTIIITFVALNTQWSYDWLEISCDSGTAFTPTHYSGSNIPAALSLSSCNLVKVHFHTDASTAYAGFSLKYNITSECDDRHFSGLTGIISSPNHPLPYANYLDCDNYLSVPSGHTVILTFSSFNTQRYKDLVTITCSHGNVFTWPSYSGSNVPAALTISSCNLVEVHFHSDGSVTDKGFSLTYSITPDNVIVYQNQDSQVLILGAMLGVAALIITIILVILLICKCLQKKRNAAADVGRKCDGNEHELQQREGESNLYSNDVGKPAGVDQSEYDNPEASRRRLPAEPAVYQALLKLKK